MSHGSKEAASADAQKQKNRELLLKMMMDGARVHMWAMQSLAIKARAFLAVGAIVAGILVAGLGTAVGLLADDPGILGALLEIPAWALTILASCGIGSIVSMLLSIYYSLRALKTIAVSAIGFEPFAQEGEESMDWEKLAKWADMAEDEIYKCVLHLCFVAMKSLKKDNSKMANYANRGKTLFFVSLCAGFTFAVAALSLSLAMGVFAP